MNILRRLTFFLISISLGCSSFAQNQPIQLLADNPHYFEYKGKPMALITSAEHYGAVLNLDFDFEKYLTTLHDQGMNYTRVFVGSYFEIPEKSFSIQHNTLAPNSGKVIVPWVSKIVNGRNQYDWDSFDALYFKRLNEFMTLASSLDIIVEVTLFSSIYNEDHWEMNPQNPVNRKEGTGELNFTEIHTLNNNGFLPLQKKYVEKIVNELNRYDNFFFEIQNEPWSDRGVSTLNIANKHTMDGSEWQDKVKLADQASLDWQNVMSETIAETEANLPKKHLIAQNYSNFYAPLAEVSPHISILNFHYNWPESATDNYHFNKVIGFDESGFAGNSDKVYRRQAWAFLLSGGGLFNSLDYSFYVGKEDGTGTNKAPGGGSTALRSQLKILSEFIHSLDLNKLKPSPSSIISSPGMKAYGMKSSPDSFAIYLLEAGSSESELTIKTTSNQQYQVSGLNTLTGQWTNLGMITSINDELIIPVKLSEGEIALKISKISVL